MQLPGGPVQSPLYTISLRSRNLSARGLSRCRGLKPPPLPGKSPSWAWPDPAKGAVQRSPTWQILGLFQPQVALSPDFPLVRLDPHLTDLRQQLAVRKARRRTFKGYMRFIAPPPLSGVHGEKAPQDPAERHLSRQAAGKGVWPLLHQHRVVHGRAGHLRGIHVIGLWGIDPTSKSYSYQRPTLKYLLAIAKRRGIKIVLPKSLRLKIPSKPRFVRTKVLYAYGWRSKHAWWRDRVRKRLRALRRKRRRRR